MKDSSIEFFGYAANGTLARSINGTTHVHLFDEEIPVSAGIHTFNGFSADADRAKLFAWHSRTAGPERTFLVHVEQETMRSFSALLKNTRLEMPGHHQVFQL